MYQRFLIIISIIIVGVALFVFSNIKADTDHIIISQVQITGGSGKTTNDFIELYNPTSADIDLKNYRLVKRTKISTSDSPIKSWSDTSPGSAIIKTHGFYLWANADFVNIEVIPDTTTGYSIANDNAIALRNGPENSGTIIDSIAWGLATNTFIDSSVFVTNPPANQSLERNLDGSGFFLQTTAHPRNSQSQTTPVIQLASPVSTTNSTSSDSTTPTATVTSTPSPSPIPTATLTPTPETTPSPTPTSTPIPTQSETSQPSPEASADTATSTSTSVVTPGVIINTLSSPTPITTPVFSPAVTPELTPSITPTSISSQLVAVINQSRPVVRTPKQTPIVQAVPSPSLSPAQSPHGFTSWLVALFLFFVNLF